MRCTEHNSEDVEKLFNEAISLSIDYKVDKAIEILEHILNCHPEEFPIWNIHQHLGTNYYDTGKYDQAIFHLNKTIELIDVEDGLHSMINYDYLASSYYQISKYETALRFFKKADKYLQYYEDEKWRTSRHLYYMKQGRCFIGLNRFDDAIEKFLLSLNEAQGYSDEFHKQESLSTLYLDIGRVYIYKKSPKDALEYFSKVNLKYLYENLHTDYYFYLIKAYSMQKEYHKLLDEFINYEKLGIPDEYKAEMYHLVGSSYFHLAKKQKAYKYLTKSQEINKSEAIKEENEKLLKQLDFYKSLN